jgi:hypothetical protein
MPVGTVHAEAASRSGDRLREEEIDGGRGVVENGPRRGTGANQLGVCGRRNRPQSQRGPRYRGQRRTEGAFQYEGAGSGAAPTCGRSAWRMRTTRPAAIKQSRPDVMNASW